MHPPLPFGNASALWALRECIIGKSIKIAITSGSGQFRVFYKTSILAFFVFLAALMKSYKFAKWFYICKKIFHLTKGKNGAIAYLNL